MAITTSSAPTDTGHERDAALKRETIRNRMNQRAFRSRKQEYVRELEEQVRTFQKEGVKATQEVQVAARHVALENTLLRKFVKVYAKCSDRDIDLLLVHMRDGSVDIPCSFRSEHDTNQSIRDQHTSCAGAPGVTPSNTVNTAPKIPSAQKSPNVVTLAPATETSQVTQPLQTSMSTVYPRSVDDAAPIDAPEQTGHRTSASPLEDRPKDTNRKALSCQSDPQEELRSCKLPEDSISCEEAAAIIAGLRMRNAEESREELGCATQDSCHIRNITLLQLMNETF